MLDVEVNGEADFVRVMCGLCTTRHQSEERT